MVKGTVKESDVVVSKYPCLKTTKDGEVVFFTAPSTGFIVVAARVPHPVGYFSSNWGEDVFTKVDGSVVLKNI